MKKISARQLTTAAAIAALYTVLSLASSFIPPVGGVFQFRVSEALTILPYFTPAAIPGLFIGCLLSNLITGALPYDLVFGSLATLIGAIGTFALRKLGKNTSRTLPGRYFFHFFLLSFVFSAYASVRMVSNSQCNYTTERICLQGQQPTYSIQ